MKSFEHVQTGYWGASPSWRPQPLWLPVGAVTGTCAGAVVGAALLAAASLEDLEFALLGAWYGGIVGAIIGLATGLVLTFAVGGHLALPIARDRAFAITTLVVAVPLVPASALFVLSAFPFFSTLLATLVSVLSGLLARWIAPAL